MTEFHDALGVEPTATKPEIKTAFREQIQRYHPDTSTHPDADALFKDLKTAKEGLIEGRRPRSGELYYEWDNGEPVEPRSETSTDEQAETTTGRAEHTGNSTSGTHQSPSEEPSEHQQQHQQTPTPWISGKSRRAVIYGSMTLIGYWVLSGIAEFAWFNQGEGSGDGVKQLASGGTIETPDGLEISVQDITQSTRIYKYDAEYGNWRIPFEDYVGYETVSLGAVRHFITIEVQNTTEEGRVVNDDLLDISTGRLLPQTEYIAADAIIEDNTPYHDLTVNPGETETALLIANLPFERPDTVHLTATFDADANNPDVALPLDISPGEAAFDVESVDVPSPDESSTSAWFEQNIQIRVTNTGAAPGVFKPDLEWAEGIPVNGAAWPKREAATIQPGKTKTLTVELGIDPIVSRDNPEPEYHIEGEEYDFFD